MNLVVSTPLRNDFIRFVDSFGKSYGVVLSVEDCVVELHEGVTQDEHVFVVMSEDSQGHHRDGTFLNRSLVLSPVVGRHIEVLTIDNKSHFRLFEFTSLLAGPSTLEILILLLLELLDSPGRETHERGARVRGNSALLVLAEA